MATLYSIVLASYTFEDLKELCFSPESTFRNVFDVDWGIWRDKAVADFNISPEFFDLIRALSGPQRYLQIATYVKLSPRSHAVDGQGVYETYSGFVEGIERGDGEMALWFYQRLSSRQKREIHPGLDELKFSFPPKKVEELDELCSAMSQGRVDLLDKILHKYFSLPKEFRVSDLDRGGLQGPFPLYDLPLQDTNQEEMEKIVQAALMSADVRIVDFVRSVFRDRNLRKIYTRTNFSRKSLFKHGKPEETYKITLRFLKEKDTIHGLYHMSELVPYQSQQKNNYHNLVTHKLGNLPLLSCLLPFLERDEVERVLVCFSEKQQVLYPLSLRLLEENKKG